LARGPGCRTALICLRYRLLSPCAPPSVRALPVSPSEQGNCGHIPAPAILSHPHHGWPAHTPPTGSNAQQRSTGSVLHCREAQPFGGHAKETPFQGRKVRSRV
jgi:hypothetical protein